MFFLINNKKIYDTKENVLEQQEEQYAIKWVLCPYTDC